jgi:hypothetical protein
VSGRGVRWDVYRLTSIGTRYHIGQDVSGRSPRATGTPYLHVGFTSYCGHSTMTSSLKSTLRQYTAYFLAWTVLGLFPFSQSMVQKRFDHDLYPWWHHLTGFMVGVLRMVPADAGRSLAGTPLPLRAGALDTEDGNPSGLGGGSVDSSIGMGERHPPSNRDLSRHHE